MNKTISIIFFVLTGFFCNAQTYETINYNLNGTPTNGVKIKTNLPFTNGTQMITLKVEGYNYGGGTSIGLNIVWYIYNGGFYNFSASSWASYAPDIYLSNENGLVCVTFVDKGYFQRFKVTAFAKGMSAEIPANFQGWTVADEVAAGLNITPVPYKNLVKNITVSGNLSGASATFSGTVTAPAFTGSLSGNASTATHIAWSGVTSKPTTLSGYGITDAATVTSVSALDANAVHKNGNETITGIKLFSTNVGIGTTNTQGYKLAVGGTIIAENIKIKPQTAWPDYVFEKDHPMRSLRDLERFILANKHLPDIPSAQEVKKVGLDIGEMNAKLLQKIEELTLYLIEKDKEIKKLTDTVHRLSNAVNSIKNK